MKKFLRVYKYISIIAGIAFLISIGLSFLYGLKGDVFLKVDNENRGIIIEMCELEDISLKGSLTQIGCKQGLGDWYLYLYYEDGSTERDILDDTVGAELRTYIRENGQVGGTKGMIAGTLVKVSASVVGTYIICILIYQIVKRNGNSH